MKLEWSPVARERAAFIDAWWREERPAAPNRFTEELIAAIHIELIWGTRRDDPPPL